jgi:hypothetical protein
MTDIAKKNVFLLISLRNIARTHLQNLALFRSALGGSLASTAMVLSSVHLDDMSKRL